MGAAMKRSALALALLASACGSSPSTPTPSPTPSPRPRAAIVVSVETQPLVPSGDPTKPILASWIVAIQETNGVGGNLTFVNSSLRDARSGASARPTGNKAIGAEDLAALLGSTRLEAHANVRVPANLSYSLASGGRSVRLAVAVQVRDDSGNMVSATAEALFQ